MPGAYATAVLADAPLHYWRCDDPGGVLLFDIGSSPILLYQDSTNGQAGYSGPNSDGGSIYTNGHEWKSAQAYNLTQPFTFEAIAWKATAGVNVYVGQANGQMGVDASDHVICTTPGSALTSTHTWPMESWHHIAMVCAAGQRNLYFDSALVVFDNTTAAARNDVFYAGGVPGAASNWLGFVSEVAFYNAALSAGRITAHFAAADNLNSQPQFILDAQPGVPPNPPVTNTQMLAQILASVRKNY